MPSTSSAPPRVQPPQKHKRLFRYIVMFLLALIVTVGVAVLVIWLVIKPKRLVYTIEDGTIHNFNISKSNHLNSTFDFVIRAYNPNGRASIYYDSIEVSVAYDDQNIAFNSLVPFHQPTRNVTRLEARVVAQDVALSSSISKDLKLEKSSGLVDLDVYIKAKIRFKVGVWKSDRRTLRVVCSPVISHVSSSKRFQRTDCEVDL